MFSFISLVDNVNQIYKWYLFISTLCILNVMNVLEHETNSIDQLHLIFSRSNSKPLYRKNVSTSLDNINEC